MTSRRKDLPARVLEYGRSLDLFPREGTLLVAVSGGADSMVLLDCLVRVRAALGIGLVVGHVDHRLRASSGADAEFVEVHAGTLGLPAVVRRADVGAVARERGRTIEEAARDVRYALLAEMAREVEAGAVATAHTATDQAETVLMRLIRGTGPAGLAGVEPDRGDGFIRPLLCATRDEVRRFARARRLSFCEDPTNRDPRFLRNRVRTRILPALRRLNPRIDFALSDLADDARDLNDWIGREIAGTVLREGPEERRIPASAWFGAAPALRPYLVLHAFHDLTGAPLGLSRPHVQAVLRVASSPPPSPPAALHLPRGVTVRWDRRGLAMTLGEEEDRRRRRPSGPRGRTP